MNRLYTTLLFVSGSFFAFEAVAQNVRSVQTSTNPQPRQVNNTPVIVIPKNEPNAANKEAARSGQKENSNSTVRKIENNNPSQGNKRQVNKRGK